MSSVLERCSSCGSVAQPAGPITPSATEGCAKTRRDLPLRATKRCRRWDAMEYGTIERELHIDAAPEIVFEVLSRPEHIRDWWSAETDFAPVVGAASSFTWTDRDTGREDN